MNAKVWYLIIEMAAATPAGNRLPGMNGPFTHEQCTAAVASISQFPEVVHAYCAKNHGGDKVR